MNEHAAGARAHVPTATHPRCEQFQFSLLDALALTERVDVRIEVHPPELLPRTADARLWISAGAQAGGTGATGPWHCVRQKMPP